MFVGFDPVVEEFDGLGGEEGAGEVSAVGTAEGEADNGAGLGLVGDGEFAALALLLFFLQHL